MSVVRHKTEDSWGKCIFGCSILISDVATVRSYIPWVYIFHARGHGIVKLPIGFEVITLSTSILYWLFFQYGFVETGHRGIAPSIFLSRYVNDISRERVFTFDPSFYSVIVALISLRLKNVMKKFYKTEWFTWFLYQISQQYTHFLFYFKIFYS